MSQALTYLPQFLHAMGTTLWISFSGSFLGVILSFVFFYVKHLYPSFDKAIKTYVWVIRGTPFLSQLFLLYFGLPKIGVTLDATPCCIIALGFYSAAYFYEIFRTAWNSVPKGHVEAATAHGIPPINTLIHIQVPQALAFALPMLGSQLILMIKESSIASVITVPELTMVTGSIVANNFSYVIPYALMIICYWVLTESVGVIASKATLHLTRYKRG